MDLDGKPMGSVLVARWGPEEVPLFVRAGTVITLRTMASTHAVFVDPLVWLAWPGHTGSIATARLFEDAGDLVENLGKNGFGV